MTKFSLSVRSAQNGVAHFNYLLLQKVNRFINKAISVLSQMSCLIFSILHAFRINVRIRHTALHGLHNHLLVEFGHACV